MKTKLFTILTALMCATAVEAQTTVTKDADLRNAITDGATIKLGASIDLSNSTLSIPEGTTVTIDLGGYALDRRLTKRGEGGGQVITVRNGATLNLSNGTLKGGWGGNGGGLVNEGGTVTLTDVNITGNTADDRGGGISNHGTLTMTGGSISGNMTNDQTAPEGGGGIFNYYNSTATLTNVSISGNVAQAKGGGGVCNYGTITLNNCIITGNHAQLNGGGIWDGRVEGEDVSVLIINGCTITGNTAEGKGGGIYGSNVYGDPGHEGLRMTGAVTVTDNVGCGGLPDNLFLDHRKYVYVIGALTGSNIGVTLEIPPYEFTKNYNTYNSGVDINSIFHPDMSDIMTITLSSNNEGYMIKNIPDDVIYYLERAWDDERKEVTATFKYLTERIDNNATPTSETQYKVLNSTSDAVVHLGTENSELHEFYVVDSDVDVFSLFVDGPNVHLILCDQSQLTLGDELRVTEGHTLYIHNQSTEVNMGKIRRPDSGTTGCIGGNNDSDTNLNGGNIEIHGGDLDLFCHDGGSAIGGRFKNIGDIKIYGGKIKAESIHGAAGIGGGVGSIYYGNINIYGGTIQAIGSDNMPDLNANGGAGIGGGMGCEGGDLHIYGGTITATTNGETAGIGCGQNGGDNAAGTIIIDEGFIKAYGGNYGAGIGGGDSMNGADLTINGGHVEAYGGTDAAGIGGGEGGNGGTVTINGGYVYAKGGWEYGAGIGGGQDGEGANVTINGGTVIAKAGSDETGCRAIGPGEGCDNYGSLTIGDNMMVSSERMANVQERKDMCWYRTQVSVDPCTHKNATYTVSGTTAEDTHKRQCSYCSDHTTEKHTFENGKCTVCGVGATAYDVRIYLPKDQGGGSYDGKTYSSQTIQMGLDNKFTMPSSPTTIPGLEFKGWEVSSVTDDTYKSTYTTTDGGAILKTGDEYTITGNISFIARYQTLDISLSDNADNSLQLLQYNGKTANSVTLGGRTFIKDNKWNTLCLPFALSAEQLAASPLAGCTLKELDVDAGSYEHITGFDEATGTLYLNFKTATGIEAGKAYLIRWDIDSNIENPTFSNVTINNVLYGVRSKDKTIAFGGTYNARTFTEENRSILFLGCDNKLYYPIGTDPVNINAFRAYFQLKGITAGNVSETKMFFGDLDSEDGINTIKNEKRKDKNDIYNLNGQRLSKPQNGINIINGKKVIK